MKTDLIPVKLVFARGPGGLWQMWSSFNDRGDLRRQDREAAAAAASSNHRIGRTPLNSSDLDVKRE